MFLTAGLASAKYFLKHVSRQNTLTQARRNISRHYDLVCSLNLHLSYISMFTLCFEFIIKFCVWFIHRATSFSVSS